MKLTSILVSLVAASSSVAMAHGDIVDMTIASVTQGLAQLKVDHPEHIAHFQGVKAWPSADKIELKIYLPDNASVSYTCEHDEAAENETKCTMKM